MLGKFLGEHGRRERLVVATKFTMNTDPGHPNAAGNGRKNTCRALEGSLWRLKTDYIDLYWLHVWDTVTPAESRLHAERSGARRQDPVLRLLRNIRLVRGARSDAG
jgi:aryl-alcohol dehydrogenase-like predicted oxidoreductase